MGASMSPQMRPARRSSSDDYQARRAWIAEYFDRTASAAWAQLTSDAPVGRVRASVRRGRDQMRQTLLSWLPSDMHGATLLDAGCGTGALAIAAAQRGAQVLAVDLSPTLINHALERVPSDVARRVTFSSGDMMDPALGTFNYVVAMDSIIHYRQADMQRVLNHFIVCADQAVLFTVAPRTPLLTTMHTVGRLFPRGDRAPAIEPVTIPALCADLDQVDPLWSVRRQSRISSGFYTSHAIELARGGGIATDQEDLFI